MRGVSRCETLRLVVHPSGVYPLNSVDAGVVRHVFVPALSGKGDGVRSLPAGCDLDELTVASSEKISDSFVVLRTGSECSLDKRQTNAKALGAVGMLLVFGAENANEGVQIDGIEPDSIPFSFLSSSDWTKIAQCKDANISLLVLSDDLLYMSFGGMLQWTLVRGIAFWFSLQAIICIAAVSTSLLLPSPAYIPLPTLPQSNVRSHARPSSFITLTFEDDLSVFHH